MKSLRRQGILVAAEAISRFCRLPWKKGSSVRTESAVAPERSRSAASDLRVEVGPDQALRGRGFLQFGDNRRPAGAGFAQRAGESARCVFGGALFQLGGGYALAAKRHVGAGLSENAVQMQTKSPLFPV